MKKLLKLVLMILSMMMPTTKSTTEMVPLSITVISMSTLKKISSQVKTLLVKSIATLKTLAMLVMKDMMVNCLSWLNSEIS